MGTLSYLKGVFIATWSGLRHLTHPRMTLRYPEQKLDLEGTGYSFSAKQGVGFPGFKGRHILFFDKCTGCDLCAIACDGVAVAIEMQHIPKGKPHNKREIWPAVDYGRCVPRGTPVVTSEGTLPIEQIKVGDRVLTHRGSFKPVTEVFRRKYSGRMYTFRTLGNPESLSVTEGHPILIYSGNGTRWVDPGAIRYRTYLTRPVIAEVKQVPVLEYTYELYHPAGRGGYFTIESVSLELTPELARLVGYYLSEGNSNRYRVTFDIHKKEEALANDIVRCVKSVFGETVSFKPEKRSEGLKLVVDSVRTAAFFRQFGNMCDRKQLPGWAMVISPDMQAEIVKTAYWGDGHYSNKYYSYKHAMHSNFFVIRTTSLTLANQYAYILARLGILASISANHQKGRKDCYSVTVHSPYVEKMGELVQVQAENSPSYSHSYVKMLEGIIASPVVKITTETVNDCEVWNLEVQDDNSYVAANQAVHNCVFCGLCLDPDTPVVVNPDLIPIKQLVVGDMVLTHSGEYKPVTKIWDMRYTGPLYRIYVYGRPEPLICTADHPILAVSRPRSARKDKRLLRVTEPLNFLKPGELKSGDYLVSPVIKKEVPIATYSRLVSVYRGGIHRELLELDANPDLFRLIGYYLAEGSCDGGRTVSFDFNENERRTVLEDCKKLLEVFFAKRCGIKKNGMNGLRLCLNSAIAEDFFSQFGKGAPNKKIPSWAFFAEKPKILELLKGYWRGDGTRIRQPRQKYFNFTTTSKVLAFQVQELLAKLNVVSLIEGQHQKGRLPSYHINVFGKWAIELAAAWGVELGHVPTKHSDKFHLTENYVFLPIRRIEVSQVEDYRVMDVTVEDDHTFAPLGLATSNCVDACPFDALFMTNDYELAAYDKMSLKYTPEMLAVPPKLEGQTFKVKIDTERGTTSHG